MLQYANGTRYNQTFIGDTKANIIAAIETALFTTVGWTEPTRTSATDITFQSLLDVNQQTTNQIKVRVWDGGGNCVRIRLSNVAGSVVQSDSCYLLPAPSKQFRIVANQYQFAVMAVGATSSRGFVLCSALSTPSFLVSSSSLQTCAIIMGDANSDTDTVTRGSFRTSLSGRHLTGGLLNGFGILNGSGVEWIGGASDQGVPALVVPQSTELATLTGNLYHDDSSMITEPLIAWGSPNITYPAKIRSQFWDMAVATDSFPIDAITTFNSANWINLTDSNAGSMGSQMTGSVWLRIS